MLNRQSECLNSELEQRVAERTYELTTSNEALRQEIATRLRAEETLASERNLLRTLIDNLPDYIYTKDTSGRFVLSNQAHLELLQARSEGDLAGKSVFDLFSEDLARRYDKDDRQVLSFGKAIHDREEEFVDHLGRTRCHLTTNSRWSTGRG